MSMQVGLANSGSDAHRDSSRPSATWKVDSARSGGTWARATAGARRPRPRKSKGQRFMARGDSVRRGGDKQAGCSAKDSIAEPAGQGTTIRPGKPRFSGQVRKIQRGPSGPEGRKERGEYVPGS